MCDLEHKDSRIRSDWLKVLSDKYSSKLDDQDLYEKLTRQMLLRSPDLRPTASQMKVKLQTQQLPFCITSGQGQTIS
jgi:DICT domain-containing protein